MTTNSRRRTRRPLALALGLVAGVPALAEAQLFPNLPIKRERPCCDAESPVFGLYRQQYYGYHPTCWRRFPPGWGCPSPEAPNTMAAMEDIRRELERQPAPEFGPDGGLPPDGGPPADPGAMPNDDLFPPMPSEERSPFDLDQPAPPAAGRPEQLPGRNPAGAPAPRDRNAPLLDAPQASAAPSAIEEMPAPVSPTTATPDPIAVPAPDESIEGESESEGDLGPAPALEAPAANSEVGALGGSLGGPGVALLDVGHPTTEAMAEANSGLPPFPTSPDPTFPAGFEPGAAPALAAMPGEMLPGPAPAPAVQAPQRRGRISSLFQNIGRRRR